MAQENTRVLRMINLRKKGPDLMYMPALHLMALSRLINQFSQRRMK